MGLAQSARKFLAWFFGARPATTVRVPVMITNGSLAKLNALGYTAAEIGRMTPMDAMERIALSRRADGLQ